MHILGIILGIIFYSTQAFSLDIGLHISSKKDLTVWGDHILGQDLKTGLEYLKHNVQLNNLGIQMHLHKQ